MQNSMYEVQFKTRTRRWEAVAIRHFAFPNLAARAAERHAREVNAETRVIEVGTHRVVARFDAHGRPAHRQ